MQFVRRLPEVDEIKEEYSLNEAQRKKRENRIKEIRDILSGASAKKIICIGPCSADREDAVLEYMIRLAELQEKVKDRFLFIPRVYTSKPRTKGTGYKGLLHRPESSHNTDDIWDGVIAVRKLHLHVIQQTGLFCADEMLYPEMIYYILDLLAYVSIGARSVENQGHRLIASGLNLPVGMKNPTNGDLSILINSISAAQSPQQMIYRGWEVKNEGNPMAHGVLRGYIDILGKMHPNYHYEDLCEFYDLYQKNNLDNMSVLIDCNHCNSGKKYDHQIRIAKEVFYLCSNNAPLNRFVKGVMIESYLEDGAQLPGGVFYGKSITDSCLGWEKTEKLILDIYEQ